MLFRFSCYLPFSSHLAGNLASGCSLLGLFGSFFWALSGHFLRPLAHQCCIFARTFFDTFLGPICGPKIHQNRDQIWGANGRPDALFPKSIPRWALLGPGVGFWCILGPSWGVCGALLGHPGAILGPSWALLGHPVAILGHSCSLFGRS